LEKTGHKVHNPGKSSSSQAPQSIQRINQAAGFAQTTFTLSRSSTSSRHVGMSTVMRKEEKGSWGIGLKPSP
jgi:hypothetical protein